MNAADPDTACAGAMQLQLAGQLDGAREQYLRILENSPQHAATHYCLGMLYVQSQQAAQGLTHLHVALKAAPGVADYWKGYLDALLLAGQTAAAREVLSLGVRQGLPGDAVAAMKERLQKADADAAQQEESRLLALLSGQRLAEAQELALGLVRRYPGRGLSWKVLGGLLWAKGARDEALSVLRESVRLLPQDAEASMNLGFALFEDERFVEAETHLRQATELAPDSAQAHYMLASNHLNQGAVAQAEAGFRQGLALNTDWRQRREAENLSNLLLAVAHNPNKSVAALFAEHRAYGVCFEEHARSVRNPRHDARRPERRLKLGFVSGDFYDHSVGTFLEPVLRTLASSQELELHAYDTNPKRRNDTVAERLRRIFSHSSAVASLSDQELARKIHDDGVDILIDLSGHTANGRLPVFAHRPAALQVSWLGYPGTTGLTAMDYYLADAGWLPPGRFDQQFTEKLVYLPDRWAFEVHAAAPSVGVLPALQSGALTFGSFHRPMKLNDEVLAMWSGVLRALPDSRLLLAGIPLTGSEQRLREKFAAHGISPDRLLIHGRCPMDRYLTLHHQVDLALDSLAYAGGTTTMHSLSMGVPTLTIEGATPQSRAGVGILANIGLDGFVARDAADFVARAEYWAAHLDELAAVRAGLRERLLGSAAGNPSLIASHLEQALRHMWRRWCAGQPAQTFSTTLAGAEMR